MSVDDVHFMVPRFLFENGKVAAFETNTSFFGRWVKVLSDVLLLFPGKGAVTNLRGKLVTR